MNTEIIELEIKQGRNRLTLRKVVPGEFLKAIHGAGVSFFYEVLLNGEMRAFTNDQAAAQAIWRGCHRWMRTGQSITADILP
jgi:hypothetical protein